MASASAVQNVHVSNHDLRDALEKAFGTDEGILEDNRCGRLAAAQFTRLTNRLIEPMVGTVVAALVFLTLWFGYSSIALKIPFEEAAGELFLRIFQPHKVFSAELVDGIRNSQGRVHSGAVIALYLLVVAALFRFPFRLLADMLGGRVYEFSGKISTFEEEGKRKGEPDGITHYYYRLPNDWVVEVRKAEYEALDPGGVYRLYYLPRSRAVVAVEPLSCVTVLPEPVSARPLTRIV
jgi:hypothetical protein